MLQSLYCLQFFYTVGLSSLVLSSLMKTWSLETMVVLFGLTHSLGGASPTLSVLTIAYISDVSTKEGKVSALHIFLCLTQEYNLQTVLFFCLRAILTSTASFCSKKMGRQFCKSTSSH